MPRLPVLSGREVVRVFESLGWREARQSAATSCSSKTVTWHRFRCPIIVRLPAARLRS